MNIHTAISRMKAIFRKSDAVIFNELAYSSGGRLLDKDLGGYSSLMLEVCQDRLERAQAGDLVDDKRLRSVYNSVSVQFVANGQVNAFTVAEKGRNYVGIYAGTPTTLADLCMTVMRCEGMFSGFSSVTDAEAAVSHLNDVFWAAAVGTERGQERPIYYQHRYTLPDSAYRAQIANDLYIVAISFLFNHELCHVARGHLDYLGAHGQKMAIFEATSEGTDLSNYRLRQWFELDADRRGAFFVMDLFNWDAPWGEYSFEPTDNQTYPPATALRIALLAIGLIFAIFDHKAEPIQANAQRSHPHPAIRLAHSFEWIVRFLVDYHGAPIDRCTEIMGDALQDLNNLGTYIDRNIVGYSYGAKTIINDELSEILNSLSEQQLKTAWKSLHNRI